ncbi:MAG TPA: CBS domain-containing protein, partial [Terracidiphilus sp.]|nr:CBS domain-containing protein [Terracidiphilus sp.]
SVWASQHVDGSKEDILLVRLQPSGWAGVSKEELEATIKEGKTGRTLESALAKLQIPYLHPDHPLEMALRYLNRWPLLPVVSRADFSKLEGVITERDVLERYRDFGGE